MDALIDNLVSYLAVILGGIFLALLRKGIQVFEARTGLDIPDPLEKYLQEAGPLAIAYAEEQGKKLLKEKAAEKLAGHQKLQLALKYLQEHAPQNIKIEDTPLVRDRIEAMKYMTLPHFLSVVEEKAGDSK